MQGLPVLSWADGSKNAAGISRSLKKNLRLAAYAGRIRPKSIIGILRSHALYSRNQQVMNYFSSLPLEYQQANRDVRIFHSDAAGKSYLLDYPFESGIKDLPLWHRFECLAGYCIARFRKKKALGNLEEWIHSHLGFGVAKHFMIPYNRKIWSCPLRDISEQLGELQD